MFGAGVAVAADHSNLLQHSANNVAEAAQIALQTAWLQSVGADEDRDPPVPSKATIMSYLTFLAHWTKNWAEHTFQYELTFAGERGVNIPGTFVPVLKEMTAMAAAMCLRSSAAEAQQQQREVAAESSLSEAMACRVLDPFVKAESVWAFNTGGSLRFIGDRTKLPTTLQHLWDIVRRVTRETIVTPPMDLGQATQPELRELLLDMMRGHGLQSNEALINTRQFLISPNCCVVNDSHCAKQRVWKICPLQRTVRDWVFASLYLVLRINPGGSPLISSHRPTHIQTCSV